MTQATLDFDAVDVKESAMARTEAHADPIWKREAIAAIEILCRRGFDFTGDDVWQLLDGVGATCHEPRALGPLIMRFAKEGRIFPTGGYRRSVRRACHFRPLAVWRPVDLKRKRRSNVPNHIWQ